MKILTQEEASKFNLVYRTGRPSSKILDFLRNLEINQIAKIEREEWKIKSSPSVLIGGAMRDGKKFSTRTLQDKSGWIVTRIK